MQPTKDIITSVILSIQQQQDTPEDWKDLRQSLRDNKLYSKFVNSAAKQALEAFGNPDGERLFADTVYAFVVLGWKAARAARELQELDKMLAEAKDEATAKV